MKKALNILLVILMSVTLLGSFIVPSEVEAAKRGGGDAKRGGGDGKRGGGDGKRNVKVNDNKRDVRTNKVRNTSVNKVNVNRSTNIDIDVDRDHHHHHGWDDDYHPIATAAAVAVTAAVIGSVVRTVPANCVPVNYGGIVYQQCGSSWYQPQYVGSSVQYVVVVAPY